MILTTKPYTKPKMSQSWRLWHYRVWFMPDKGLEDGRHLGTEESRSYLADSDSWLNGSSKLPQLNLNGCQIQLLGNPAIYMSFDFALQNEVKFGLSWIYNKSVVTKLFYQILKNANVQTNNNRNNCKFTLH